VTVDFSRTLRFLPGVGHADDRFGVICIYDMLHVGLDSFVIWKLAKQNYRTQSGVCCNVSSFFMVCVCVCVCV
jgi:hypothetical protein